MGAFNAAVLAQRPVNQTAAAVAELSHLWSTLSHPGLRQLPSRLRIMVSVLVFGACSGSVLSRSWLDCLAGVVDWEAVASSDRLLLIGVTAFANGEAEYHSNGACACGRRHTPDQLREYLVASMSVPALFPEVEIDGREVVDGGLADIVPRIFFGGSSGVDVICSEPAEPAPRWRLATLNVHMRLYMATSSMASALAQSNLEWLHRAYGGGGDDDELCRGSRWGRGDIRVACATFDRRVKTNRLNVVRPRRLDVVSGLVGLSLSTCKKLYALGHYETRPRDVLKI